MKISELSDEDCLKKFLKMLDTRVGITTNFINNDDGYITHQVLRIRCGSFISVSQPQPLASIMRLANAEELRETLN